MNEVKENKMSLLVLSFFLGGVIGGAWETLWTLLKDGHLLWKSGIMFFPLCNPIYGIGALIITIYALKENNLLKLYLFSFLSCTFIEFFFSLSEELVFHSISWDYSSHFMNIGGRVNLLYSLFWGLLALAWCSFILPHLKSFTIEEKEKSSALISTLLPLYLLLMSLSIIAMAMYSLNAYPAIFSDRLMNFFYPTRQVVL